MNEPMPTCESQVAGRPRLARRLLAFSAWWAAAAVALGAFGAHALTDRLPDIHPPEAVARMAANWETAARYHLIHALASVVAAGLARGSSHANPAPSRWQASAAWLPSVCFLAGSAIFAGCLYLMVLGGPKILGAIVPVGGGLMILGWVVLGWVAWFDRPSG